MKVVLGHMLSPVTQSMVALPAAVWLLAAVYVLGIPYEVAVGTIAVRVFSMLMTVMVIASAIYSYREHDYAKALIQSGFSILLCHLIVLNVFAFRGTMSIGVGEVTPQFTEVGLGPLARIPEIPISLVSIQAGTTSSAVVVIDARRQTIASGQTFPWHNYELKLTTLSHAPLLVLNDLQGKELDAGYVKLHPENTEPSYFQFPIIPHRFYIAPADWKGAAWKREGDKWVQTHKGDELRPLGDDPESLTVNIMRGKLRIAGGLIKRGSTLPFNEYSVRFEKGLPWAEFSVRKRPAFVLLYAGIGLVVLGVATRLLARRST